MKLVVVFSSSDRTMGNGDYLDMEFINDYISD
jgi:hypothetical protein